MEGADDVSVSHWVLSLGITLMFHIPWTRIVRPRVECVLYTFGNLWSVDALPEYLRTGLSSPLQ